MIQHPRVERTTVHAARRYGHTLYVSVRRRLSTLIAVEGKCTDSSCREIGAVPGRAPRGGYRSNGYRTRADRRPDRGAHHVPGIASSSRRRAPGSPSRSTTQRSLRHPPCHRAARITHSGARRPTSGDCDDRRHKTKHSQITATIKQDLHGTSKHLHGAQIIGTKHHLILT